MGIRPTPAFGHGCANWVVGVSKYSRIPNLVKSDYPLWRTGHPEGPAGGLPKDHIAQTSEIK